MNEEEALENALRLIRRNRERQEEPGPRKKKGLYNHRKNHGDGHD